MTILISGEKPSNRHTSLRINERRNTQRLYFSDVYKCTGVSRRHAKEGVVFPSPLRNYGPRRRPAPFVGPSHAKRSRFVYLHFVIYITRMSRRRRRERKTKFEGRARSRIRADSTRRSPLARYYRRTESRLSRSYINIEIPLNPLRDTVAISIGARSFYMIDARLS